MATLQNQFAQTVLGYALREYGTVVPEAQLPVPEPQRADLVFIPATTASPPNALPLGDLARLLTTPVLLEPFSEAPSLEALRALVRKVLVAQHTATKTTTLAPYRSLEDAVLWVICAERPTQAMAAARCVRLRGWGRGYYTISALLPLRLVVVGELPDNDDTLLLRLLGTEAVRRDANEKLRARAERDPRFAEVLNTLVEYWRRRMPSETREDTMWDLRETEKWLQEQRAKAIATGLQEGRVQGMQQGRREGSLDTVAHQFERRLGRPLTEPERETLSARITTLGGDRVGDVVLDSTRDELARWLVDPNAR